MYYKLYDKKRNTGAERIPPRRTRMSDEKALSELVEDLVEKGATTAEEIHRAVADLPVTVLERLGLFEQVTHEVRRIQDASIGAVYELIRDVNHRVAQLAGDFLEQTESDPNSGVDAETETNASTEA
jgi:polyhydroxyalkanoate synthesis regulator phasin